MRLTDPICSRGVRLTGAVLLALACGCTQELETGYKPRALSASPAERRAYYASPFSPEAAEGAKEAPASSGYHKPGSL